MHWEIFVVLTAYQSDKIKASEMDVTRYMEVGVKFANFNCNT